MNRIHRGNGARKISSNEAPTAIKRVSKVQALLDAPLAAFKGETGTHNLRQRLLDRFA
jgi:hypothetical protein